jgi:hypothetical protein
MDGWMDGWMDAWMAGWLDGWMDGWMDGLIYIITKTVQQQRAQERVMVLVDFSRGDQR